MSFSSVEHFGLKFKHSTADLFIEKRLKMTVIAKWRIIPYELAMLIMAFAFPHGRCVPWWVYWKLFPIGWSVIVALFWSEYSDGRIELNDILATNEPYDKLFPPVVTNSTGYGNYITDSSSLRRTVKIIFFSVSVQVRQSYINHSIWWASIPSTNSWW